MLNLFKAKNREVLKEIQLNNENIPKHVAIIMDGNGRWAKSKNLPRTMGHKAGVETIRRVIKEADRIGIEYITLYAFSTENWKRPKTEVNALMNLLVQYLRDEIKNLHENSIIVRVLGDIENIPIKCKREIEDAIKLTKDNNGLVLNIAFNYGGRDEIIRSIKLIVEDIEKGKIDKTNIDQELFSKYLYTKDSPDPDLIIRPSGEQRISNFLLWQCAYSEFWYSNVNWPDFKEQDLRQAIYDYQNRDRRFGGV